VSVESINPTAGVVIARPKRASMNRASSDHFPVSYYIINMYIITTAKVHRLVSQRATMDLNFKLNVVPASKAS
jgi:hypothetical protein